MALLDWAFALLLISSGVLGGVRGLVWEVLSLLGWVVAFVVAKQSVNALSPFFVQHMAWAAHWPLLTAVLCFVVVFVLSAFVFGLLSALLKKAVQAVGLRPIDRSLGVLFGLLRGLFLLLLIVALVQLTPWQHSPPWQESHSVGWLKSILVSLAPFLPSFLVKGTA
jgi:membrane protein required for colicin V production